MVTFGKRIKTCFNDIVNKYDINCLLIENQIGPLANKMNSIQGIIMQYFIMKDLTNINFISATNKLKLFIGNQKTSYNERKKISISITKKLLNNNWIEYINKHSKKDDLADCFLQGIWYLYSQGYCYKLINDIIL